MMGGGQLRALGPTAKRRPGERDVCPEALREANKAVYSLLTALYARASGKRDLIGRRETKSEKEAGASQPGRPRFCCLFAPIMQVTTVKTRT
jgi:hypothetical protein